jgi:hypothetical protein
MAVGLQLVAVRIVVRTAKSQLLSRDLGLWPGMKKSPLEFVQKSSEAK